MDRSANQLIAYPSQSDMFDQMRARWLVLLTGGPDFDPVDPDIAGRIGGAGGIDETATNSWKTLNTAADRTVLWADSPGDQKSDEITRCYERLKSMALAYSTRGSRLYNNQELRETILDALDWLHANRYFIRAPYDNWFPWQIGIPLALCDTCALLYDHLSGERLASWMAVVDSFTPAPAYTAANLVWKTTVVVERAILIKEAAKLALARDGVAPAFAYVTSGDGFYQDGSFIQHERLPYTGGYGSAMFSLLTRLLYLLHGSPWELLDAGAQNVYRWVYDSFEPVIFRGAMMDMVRGREISREASQDHTVGQSVIAAIAWAAQSAPADDSAAFEGMVKRWIEADTFGSPFARASVATIALLKQILARAVARPPLDTYRQFPAMDRAVVQRPEFAFGISMSSSRIFNYETNSFLKENKRGWYTADGMTYLYNADVNQFSADFWPTVDARRLPGITVDSSLPREPYSGQLYLSPKSWVGGVELGHYGLSGMELAAWGSSLVAKKSWFAFDDVIVALGSGITSSDSRVIETIVENRKLADETQVLTIDGEAMPTQSPWRQTVLNPRWAHLAGESGAEIGYFFPAYTALRLKRETRTDSWFAINEAFGSDVPRTNSYLSIACDHGTNPNNASYAYALLPNRSLTDMAQFAAAPSFVIEEHSTEAHAVADTNEGVFGAAFWSDQPHTVSRGDDKAFLTCSGQAAVMLRFGDDMLEIAVADPTQLNTGIIAIAVNVAAVAVIAADPSVQVVQVTPRLEVRVNVAEARGQTQRARLALSTPARPS